MTIKRYLVITLVLAASTIPFAAHAQDSADASRLAAIQQRCTVLQTSLDQLQRRDLVARTNRGREYENVNRQIDAFITRLYHNNLSSATMDGPISDYKTAVLDFRDAYVRYDDSMTALLQIDCSKNVSGFAKALDASRVLRAAVGVDVTKGEKALSSFRKALVAFRDTLPKPLDGKQ